MSGDERAARKARTSESAQRLSKRKAESYEAALTRVRLVSAWVAVAAAIASMLPTYVALLERLVRWLS